MPKTFEEILDEEIAKELQYVKFNVRVEDIERYKRNLVRELMRVYRLSMIQQ